MQELIVFDTPGRDGRLWSHHVLRVLFSLHYKQILYVIEFVEYPDIISTFESTSLKAKDDPIEPYEIPVIKLQKQNEEQYYMIPQDIIRVMDDIQPQPALLYNSPQSIEYRSISSPALAPILKAIVGHVPKILSEHSARYFSQKRQNRTGKSIEQWVVEHPIDDMITPRFKDLSNWLESAGPFINGELPSYADFTITSILCFVNTVGFGDTLRTLLDTHAPIRRLFHAVKATQLENGHVKHAFDLESKGRT